MNIAIVTQQFSVGGAETYIISKSEQLVELGHKVIVISEGGCMVSELHKNVNHFVVKGIASLPYSHNCKERRRILEELSRVLIDNDIQIIEAHNFAPILYVALSYTKHKIPYLHNNLQEFSYDKSFQLRWLTKNLSSINSFFVLNKTQLTYIENKCGCKLNAQIIPMPVLVPQVSEQEQGIGGEEDYILSVGRLEHDKGYLEYALKGFEGFREKNPNSDLKFFHIVGDGSLFEYYTNEAERINKKLGYKAITLRGSLIGGELATEYANCSMFLGVGACLLIAAAFSKPILLSSAYEEYKSRVWGFWGCNAELDANSADGNELYEGKDMSYDSAMEKLSIDHKLRDYCGDASCRLFNQVFNVNTIINRWIAEYNDVSYRDHSRSYQSIEKKLHVYNTLVHVIYRIKHFRG